MKSKKVVALLTACVISATALAGCGSSKDTAAAPAAPTEEKTEEKAEEKTEEKTETSTATPEYELKLSTNLAEEHVGTKGYYSFADKVEKATDGKVKVTVYSGEQLGKEADVVSSVNMHAGTADMVCPGFTELAKYNKVFSLFDAPYIFNDGESMTAFANSDDIQPLYDELAEASNLRVLATYYYGARDVTTKGYAATTPDGLKGCKLRVPDSEMSMAYGKALGATPTVMSLGEVYMGIQQGVVDGQENPLPTIDANAFYEVCDSLILTQHVTAGVLYVIDEQTWQTLPEDIQATVKSCALEAAEETTKAVEDQEATLLDKMEEKGMTIVEPDKEAFKANCQFIYDKYSADWGEWYDASQKFNK